MKLCGLVTCVIVWFAIAGNESNRTSNSIVNLTTRYFCEKTVGASCSVKCINFWKKNQQFSGPSLGAAKGRKWGQQWGWQCQSWFWMCYGQHICTLDQCKFEGRRRELIIHIHISFFFIWIMLYLPRRSLLKYFHFFFYFLSLGNSLDHKYPIYKNHILGQIYCFQMIVSSTQE
jgi:hypothetical protein